MRYRVNRRGPRGNRSLSERWRKINRARSRTRARCEHPFRVVKQLWGFDKTRYRGIAKNLARAQTMSALANPLRRAPPTAPTAGEVRPVIDRRRQSPPQSPSQGEANPFNPDPLSVYSRCDVACAELP